MVLKNDFFVWNFDQGQKRDRVAKYGPNDSLG